MSEELKLSLCAIEFMCDASFPDGGKYCKFFKEKEGSVGCGHQVNAYEASFYCGCEEAHKELEGG